MSTVHTAHEIAWFDRAGLTRTRGSQRGPRRGSRRAVADVGTRSASSLLTPATRAARTSFGAGGRALTGKSARARRFLEGSSRQPTWPRCLTAPPPDCACAGPPFIAAEAAKVRLAVAGPLALKLYRHFLDGSGAEWTIDVADMLKRDASVRHKIHAAMKSDALTGITRLEQFDYQVEDFRFAFGAIDCVQWVVTMPPRSKRRDTTPVKIAMLDYYEFTPAAPGAASARTQPAWTSSPVGRPRTSGLAEIRRYLGASSGRRHQRQDHPGDEPKRRFASVGGAGSGNDDKHSFYTQQGVTICRW